MPLPLPSPSPSFARDSSTTLLQCCCLGADARAVHLAVDDALADLEADLVLLKVEHLAHAVEVARGAGHEPHVGRVVGLVDDESLADEHLVAGPHGRHGPAEGVEERLVERGGALGADAKRLGACFVEFVGEPGLEGGGGEGVEVGRWGGDGCCCCRCGREGLELEGCYLGDGDYAVGARGGVERRGCYGGVLDGRDVEDQQRCRRVGSVDGAFERRGSWA